MKKILTLILASTILFTVTGCGSGEDVSSQSNNSTSLSSVVSEQSSEESKTEEVSTLENWGVQDRITASNNNGDISGININLPHFTTISQGTGRIAYQKDQSLVLLGGQLFGEECSINSYDEVFPEFFNYAIGTLDVYRSREYENFTFEIDKKENVKINDYDMCKYIGTHTFTIEDKQQTMQYVAYSTAIKENGGYVYWMVLDETEDQSLAKVIESHADNMAKTVREDN